MALALLLAIAAVALATTWNSRRHQTSRALSRLTFDVRELLLDRHKLSTEHLLLHLNTFDDPNLTNDQIAEIFDQCIADISRKMGAKPFF